MYLYVTDICISASVRDIVKFMEHEFGNQYIGNNTIS